MKKFELEDRYIVVKRKDLSESQLEILENVIDEHCIETTECLVVEPDWPMYDDTLKAIKYDYLGWPNRKDVLLKAAYDLLVKCDEGPFVKNALEELVYYDGANCDGSCLKVDIEDVLNGDY